MQEQNFKNHARYVAGWHFVTPVGLLAVLIGSCINLCNVCCSSEGGSLYSASLITAIALLLFPIWFYSRLFALKAQDRAIRAEENFRHYILTGKKLDNRLTVRQIVGLRFASDEEFPELAAKAAETGMSEKEIKLTIQKWNADYYRA